MKKGYLSNFFLGVAAKRLSSVEADPKVSNQHEFNGVAQLKKLLGSERITVEAFFLYLTDLEVDRVVSDGFLTWYDAREFNEYRSEFRMYFPSNKVTHQAEAGDLLIIAKKHDSTYAVIIAPRNSTYENQLLWLFGIDNLSTGFNAKDILANDSELNFASKLILEELGFETKESDENFLDLILKRIGPEFPKTKVFSEFARSTLPDISAKDDPDEALIYWLEREEVLFRTLEEYQVLGRINKVFEDVDTFISYSLSIHNRRKSRVGHALENHLEAIFKAHRLNYSNNPKTENNARPDFLFPGIEKYWLTSFPVECLTVLGVKSTCKDRWRQILSEAQKISEKHLLTLEPKISSNQTGEMKAHNVQLVLPKAIHGTYTTDQQLYLLSLSDFITMVKDKQNNCS